MSFFLFLFDCGGSDEAQNNVTLRLSLPSGWLRRQPEMLAACHYGTLPGFHGE